MQAMNYPVSIIRPELPWRALPAKHRRIRANSTFIKQGEACGECPLYCEEWDEASQRWVKAQHFHEIRSLPADCRFVTELGPVFSPAGEQIARAVVYIGTCMAFEIR